MCQNLIEYHKEKSKMTVEEVTAGVGILALIGAVFKWAKNQLDSQSESHAKLAETLAKEYMTKEDTMQMYGLMNQSTEVRLTAVEAAVKNLSDSNEKHFDRIYDKLNELSKS